MKLALLEPLRHRNFRLLWAGQTISFFGNALYRIALPFQVFALGGSAAQLGLAYAASSGVQLVMVLFGGVLVDRLPRRQVILISDFLSGLLIGAVAILGLTHLLRLEHVYVASAFFGAAAAFYLPATSAIMPEVVPKEVLLAGNSLRGLARQLNRVIGPVAGGLVVSGLGPPVAFAVDAATFFISFVIFVRARIPSTIPGERKTFLVDLREGFAFTFSVTWIWLTILSFTVVNFFFIGAFTVGLPLLVREVLGGGAKVYGLIAAAGGVGEMAAGLTVSQRRASRPGIVMYAAAAVAGLALLAIGLLPALPVVLIASAVFAAAFFVLSTYWESALQRNVPGRLLGRVTSVDWFGSILLGPPAPLAAALVASRAGPLAIFVLGGAIALAVSLTAVLTPSIRRLP